RNSRYIFTFKVPPGNLIRIAISPNPIVQRSNRELPRRKSQRPVIDYFWGYLLGLFPEGSGRRLWFIMLAGAWTDDPTCCSATRR
ncbi:hypothetical protein, partial [Mesorhizobium sp.]|uniref:hypothetical protein n=1 Tax=Mesorhizobium sp. TaxID=1871066 RepID=UPI0025C026F6